MGSGRTCSPCSPREPSGSLISLPRTRSLPTTRVLAVGFGQGDGPAHLSSPSPSASLRGLFAHAQPRLREQGGNFPSPYRAQADGIPVVPGTAGTRLWRGSGTALLFIHRPSRGFPPFILARTRNQTPPPKPAGGRQQFRGGGHRQTVPPPGTPAAPGVCATRLFAPTPKPICRLPPQRRDRLRGLDRHYF